MQFIYNTGVESEKGINQEKVINILSKKFGKVQTEENNDEDDYF